jgi:hypothetical protein
MRHGTKTQGSTKPVLTSAPSTGPTDPLTVAQAAQKAKEQALFARLGKVKTYPIVPDPVVPPQER